MAITGEVRPFRLRVPEAELDDLRERLRRSRFPERETSEGWAQGPPLSYVRELVEHWADRYDWRRVESALNDHGQGRTTIDGFDVHLLHVRSPRSDARPLVITHGWPSSVIEPLEVMDRLADPGDPALPAFHVVAPSLPGFGFGDRPAATGWGVDRTADAWADLMARLGYDQFLAAGGDWGGRVTTALGVRHPDRVIGLHTFTPYVPRPADGDGDLSDREAGWLADTRRFWRLGGGYSLEQSTRPQTIGYGLTDSPVAQLTWILEKFQGWTDCAGDPESAVARDRILDTVTLYWLSGTAASSARFYWENFPAQTAERVEVPAAVTVFPADIEKFPRAWVEAQYRDLRYWHEAERGGHFPMLEVPGPYADELRRSLGAIT